MSDLGNKIYTSDFTGLSSNGVLSIVLLFFAIIGRELLVRLRRTSDGVVGSGSESYAMGYLFRARSFIAVDRTRDFDGNRWFAWVYELGRMNESFYLEHVGCDAALYIRFLRGAFYWTLISSCTTFPILLTINVQYSPPTILRTSIERASITSLILTEEGKDVLWVNVLCAYTLTISWMITLGWIGYGAIRNRRTVLRKMKANRNEGEGKLAGFIERRRREKRLDLNGVQERDEFIAGEEDWRRVDEGWRYRTILLRNIPESMRSEVGITDYFKTSPIDHIVLVRKEAEVNELYYKRIEVQCALEAAHVLLARNVIAWGLSRRALAGKVETRWERWTNRTRGVIWNDAEMEAGDEAEQLYSAIFPFLLQLDQKDGVPTSFWTILHALPPILLDPFQPLHELRHFHLRHVLRRFHSGSVPSIDYHSAKLQRLTESIEKERLDPARPGSSAFVTFHSVSDARKAKVESGISGKRLLRCQVLVAPEVRDINWKRIVRVSLASDILRGLLFQSLIWVATLFYLLPVSFALSLISVDSITKIAPSIQAYLEIHRFEKAILVNLAPTLIVALLGLLVPTLLGILTRNGEVFGTVSRLHAAIQARYWKWIFINLIVLFCVGIVAFTTLVTELFRTSFSSILATIASAFPKGATFFVSWSLLIVGIHHAIEISFLGIPYINHASIRKMMSPRKRASEDGAYPRSFSVFYWLPNHLMLLSVSLIFAVLNPLVLPFNLCYFAFALVVFKNQFAHVYYRRHYESNGRLIFRRVFRYSLDTVIFSVVVLIAFFVVSNAVKLGFALIPLLPVAFFVKIIGTRFFDKLNVEIDEWEANFVCQEAQLDSDLSVPLDDYDHHYTCLSLKFAASTISTFATITLPSLVMRPHEKLPFLISSRFRPTPNTIPTPSPSYFASLPTRPSQIEKKTSSPRIATSGLVTTHPPIIRDDRARTDLGYHSPASSEPLVSSLWLPRNPMFVDLGDTIDFHAVLLSSEASERIEEVVIEEEEVDLVATDATFPAIFPASSRRTRATVSPSLFDRSDYYPPITRRSTQAATSSSFRPLTASMSLGIPLRPQLTNASSMRFSNDRLATREYMQEALFEEEMLERAERRGREERREKAESESEGRPSLFKSFIRRQADEEADN